MTFEKFDKYFIKEMHKWALPVLRYSLGIVFLWFGLLKVAGVSPVAGLVSQAYSFLPAHGFLVFLGIWEVLIGLGLIFNVWLRATLALLWLQMLGTFTALILAPHMFFNDGNVFLLSTEGEFIIKNLVLIASSIVIGGYGVKTND